MVHAPLGRARPLPSHPWSSQWPTFTRIRASRLSPTQRLVLRTLLDFPRPRCPSVTTLADGAGLHPRTVERSLHELVRLGWLVRAGVSPYGTSIYELADEGPGSAFRPTDPTSHGSTSIRAPGVEGPTPENSAGNDVVNSDEPPESCSRPRPGSRLGAEEEAPTSSTRPISTPSTWAASSASSCPTEPPRRPAPPAHDPAPPGRVPPDPIRKTDRERAPSTLNPEGRAVLDLLAATPELRDLATPELAARWGGMVTRARPLAFVLQGLRELADAAGDSAAAGRPWSPASIAGRARTWIRAVRPERAEQPPRTTYRRIDLGPAPPPPDLRALAKGWARVAEASRPWKGAPP